jgi:hypothetical protein
VKLAARSTKAVLMLVSFVLSMTLYLTVQTADSSPDKIQISLKVRARNVYPGLIFDHDGAIINFEVAGPRDVLDRLKKRLSDNPDALTASTDLRSETPKVLDKEGGRKLIPSAEVKIGPHPDFDNLTFTQVEILTGSVEYLKTSDVKIKVDFPKQRPESVSENRDPGDFEVIPPRISLTGPASQVDAANPTVVIDPEVVERNGVEHVPVTLMQRLTSSVPLDSVEVRALRRTRTVYVNVNFLGHIPSRFRMSNYYVVTQSGRSLTATISGPGGVVDKTGAIDATVDISALTKSYTFQPKPRLPDRLELQEPLRIRVDVEKINR